MLLTPGPPRALAGPQRPPLPPPPILVAAAGFYYAIIYESNQFIAPLGILTVAIVMKVCIKIYLF